MRSRNIWLLTALAVVGICGLPVWQGFDLIRYATADSKPEAAHPWFAVSGLAFSAREYALTSVDDSSDDKAIRKRHDELAEMLTLRPLSSYYWEQLAEIRLTAHEVPTKAVEALELSAVTGPNEGYIITHRGLFGIWQWELLPPEIQKRVVADLVTKEIASYLRSLKVVSSKPVAVGFGLTTPQQVREIARYADGVIVGSALIRAVEKSKGPRYDGAVRFVRSLKGALHAS